MIGDVLDAVDRLAENAVAPHPVFELFVVYESPADYPGQFVARRNVVPLTQGCLPPVLADAEPLMVDPELEVVREAIALRLPNGYRLERELEDDPAIREIWL